MDDKIKIGNQISIFRGITMTKETQLSSVINEVLFKDRYESKYNPDNTTEILHNLFGEYYDAKLDRISKEYTDFIETIIAAFQEYKVNTYYMALRVKRVLEFCNQNYKTEYNLDFLKQFLCRDDIERKLMLLKELHETQMTKQELADLYAVSDKTISNDIAELRNEFSFMGSTMKIENVERKVPVYSSKINPVFMALDTGEIYALTIALKKLSKNTVFESTLCNIADKVYTQLSQYSKRIIDERAEEESLTFEQRELKFFSTADCIRENSLSFEYFLKEHEPCVVTYLDNGEMKKSEGKLYLSDEMDKIVLRTENQEFLINIRDARGLEKI